MTSAFDLTHLIVSNEPRDKAVHPAGRNYVAYKSWHKADRLNFRSQRFWNPHEATEAELSRSTREMYEFAVGFFMMFAIREDSSLAGCRLSQQLTEERLERFLGSLETYEDGSKSIYLNHLLNGARRVAPDMSLGFVARLRRAYDEASRQDKEHVVRLKASAAELIELGNWIMDEADWLRAHPKAPSRGERPHPLQAAINYRDGLEIVLQTHLSFRIRNMHRLAAGEHMFPTGSTYTFLLDAIETKNVASGLWEVPQDASARIRRYLDVHRPVFPNPKRLPHLWLTETGTAISILQYYRRMAEWTEAELGERVSPHKSRLASGSWWLERMPEDEWLLLHFLTHANRQMARRHYTERNSGVASKRVQDAMADFWDSHEDE